MDGKYARSNYLMMLKVEKDMPDEELSRVLYYLKHGFSDKYEIPNKMEEEKDYYGPNGRIWGITSESSVCIIRDMENRAVIEKQFSEFKSEYFMLFSLLLFQKYTYFYFLTSLSSVKSRNTKVLKKYKEALYDFERDYVFSVITDIPQYKVVYEKMVEAFDLKQLFMDIQEPILELNDRKKNLHENVITIFGCFFSFLGLFSVIVDGNQVIDMLEKSGVNLDEQLHKLAVWLSGDMAVNGILIIITAVCLFFLFYYKMKK